MNGHTHEFEAVFGFPETLPATEKVLWQGRPCFLLVAKRIFYLPHLFCYFLVLSLLSAGLQSDLLTTKALMADFLLNMFLGTIAIVVLLSISYLVSSTTVYSITDKRLVMRIGIVLNLSLNIPFSQVQAAESKAYSDHSGDISIQLTPRNKIAYVHLWPHCRPWFFSAPRPRISCVKDVETVASVLKECWSNQKKLEKNDLRK